MKQRLLFSALFASLRSCCFGALAVCLVGCSAAAAGLVAHWKLDEAGAPFADSSGHGIPLEPDFTTTPPQSSSGHDGGAAQLLWQNPPGVATRLYAFSSRLQTDNFGFAFWFNPRFLASFDSLIAKEIPCNNAVPAYARLAWQVLIAADDGSGAAPIEFVVRGNNRAQGEFFGNVFSALHVPLRTTWGEWIHVAGGYDSATGALRLFVNGIESVSANSSPGAHSSDVSAFDIGTVRNDVDFVAFAAGADIDDVQLYDGPLSAYDTAFLLSHPGQALGLPFTVASRVPAVNGSVPVTFNSHTGWNYVIEASTDLANPKTVASLVATGETTAVTITKATLDAAFGPAPRPQLFLRARALIADTLDSAQTWPVAALVPFLDSERYVPQYHFSINGASVGDPCGLLRWQGTYHAYSWDHATSSDLVYWTPRGWPMTGAPTNFGYWTGSVAVDAHNSAGFGANAMVAAYTMHNNTTGKEDIRISSSADGLTFTYWSNNPVLTTSDQVFRDPDVFWHAPTAHWLLVAARSVEHKIQIYSSTDMKTWSLRSEFGPLGARAEIWEVPGLMPVPVRGAQDTKRWMLFCGMGPNLVQYWVGDFDGATFTPDTPTQLFLANGTGLDGSVFADFNGTDFTGWTVSGDAFGTGPGQGGTPGQPVAGYLGAGLVSSYVDGDWRTGALTSAPFTMTKNCINFLIGGGNHPGQTCVNLLVGGQVVRSATGNDSDIMRWAGWEVSAWKGQSAQIQIVDDFTGFWGRIYVDHILFSDTLVNTGREHAQWADWGSDFYGARFFRDYDGVEQGATWLAWLGNWEYAPQIPAPATWGRGAWSVPRRVELALTPRGYEVVQSPLPALRKLRGALVNVATRTVNGITPLAEFQPTANTYEIEAVIERGAANQHAGLNVCVGNGHKVVVGFDGALNNVWLDRTLSGNVGFHPAFPNVVHVPLKSATGPVKFRIFVDQCSIEVFVNDGERVLSSLILPDVADRGLELFSSFNSSTLLNLKAWQLATIWPQ